jgi:Protein of unknown function (DUF2726)
VAFSTPPKVQTFVALNHALAPLGYSISQKARVLDCVRAAAENPRASTPVGSSLADWVIPALRELAGPFGPAHPWLEEGDWRYAFKAHFDFVVHEKLDGQHPTHPLFAVEFDGASTHVGVESQKRDLRKNRLCAASGLPLVRINDTFLHRRERPSVVEWLAGLWAAHRSEMPGLLADRDAEVEAMSEEELAEAGLWLLMERPDLDVDLVFRLGHPFPPVCRLAERLAFKYGFQWSEVRAIAPKPQRRRWRVTRWLPAIPSMNGSLVQRWECKLWLVGPDARTAELEGLADVQQGYPLHDGETEDSWHALFAGRLPYLPAGPWTQAPYVVGEALCMHNILIEVEHYLRRESHRRTDHGQS